MGISTGGWTSRANDAYHSLSTSSRAADRLDGIHRTIMLQSALKVARDIETTWWSIFAMVDRILYLGNASK